MSFLGSSVLGGLKSTLCSAVRGSAGDRQSATETKLLVLREGHWLRMHCAAYVALPLFTGVSFSMPEYIPGRP